MSAPVIGISTYREEARFRMWDVTADVLHAAYARAVEAAGGVPVLLPPQDVQHAPAVVERLDGLVIAGGADVDPDLYGAQPHPATGTPSAERDEWELGLLQASREAGLPVLGVCRGMQLLAVQAGGTLIQHVPDLLGNDRHSPGADSYGATVIETIPGSLLQRLVGDRLEVACHHHQSVAEHPGLAVTARADDGTIEALEEPASRFRIGVQWHPETADDQGLFAGLVAASRLS